MRKSFSAKYYPFFVFFGFLTFFTFTINKQKLEFYSLQNAIVENLVEFKSFGMKGVAYGNEYFYNTQTKTPQLRFIGDAFTYKGLWYPGKSYGAHYWASIFYTALHYINISFSNNFYLVSSILLVTSSYLFASTAITLTFVLANKITKSLPKAALMSILVAFGSLQTGGMNIRNEETFGYWLLLIVYLSTFFNFKKKWFLIIEVFTVYFAIFSLPVATIFLPLVLYKIYTNFGKYHIPLFITINIVSISLIILNNYLIFHRLLFSTLQIGSEVVAHYRDGYFHFTLENFIEKILFYFTNANTSIFFNYPLTIFGFIGIWLSKHSIYEKIIILLTLVIFAFYITNIKENGYVGYGSGRYMLGLFPITYFYICYIIKKFSLLLKIGLYFAAVVSVSHGLFYYFSPVGHFSDRNVAYFANLPFQHNFFLVIALVSISTLFFIILREESITSSD